MNFKLRRHSAWDGCSVKNCDLTYDSGDLEKADAILFHLHRTPSVESLPSRKNNTKQRWIFLTDESPYNTFYFQPKQRITDYNGLFNWSMSYHIDSDIPVPYGWTIELEKPLRYLPDDLPALNQEGKLVALLASNCGARNNRWNYVKELKKYLGNLVMHNCFI